MLSIYLEEFSQFSFSHTQPKQKRKSIYLFFNLITSPLYRGNRVNSFSSNLSIFQQFSQFCFSYTYQKKSISIIFELFFYYIPYIKGIVSSTSSHQPILTILFLSYSTKTKKEINLPIL